MTRPTLDNWQYRIGPDALNGALPIGKHWLTVGAGLPVTALVDQFYKDVQSLGGGRWDTSSLIRRLRALA